MGVAAARSVGVGVEELPAATPGPPGSPRCPPPPGHQPPQLLGRLHPAGVAAAHADDRDRLFDPNRCPRRDRGGALARGLAGQEGGDRLGARVVEDQGRRQGKAGGPLQLVSQLHRGEGVKAQVLEGGGGIDRRCGGVAEDGGDVGCDQLQDGGLALWPGQVGQAGGERAGGGAAAAGRGPRRKRARAGGRRGRRRAGRRGQGAPPGECGVVRERARSKSSVPSQSESARTPLRAMRARSASPRRAVSSLSVSQAPQARERVGSSSAWRLWARASRKALAAA